MTIAKAIRNLVPDAVFSEADGEIDWQSPDLDMPSQSEIDTEVARLEAEKPLKELRRKRDFLISQTDWWVSSDLSPSQAQLDYRQALRDITSNYSSLDDVVWPEKP